MKDSIMQGLEVGELAWNISRFRFYCEDDKELRSCWILIREMSRSNQCFKMILLNTVWRRGQTR